MILWITVNSREKAFLTNNLQGHFVVFRHWKLKIADSRAAKLKSTKVYRNDILWSKVVTVLPKLVSFGIKNVYILVILATRTFVAVDGSCNRAALDFIVLKVLVARTLYHLYFRLATSFWKKCRLKSFHTSAIFLTLQKWSILFGVKIQQKKFALKNHSKMTVFH